MKDLFIEEYERLRSEYEDHGLDPDEYEDQIAKAAYSDMRETMLDRADYARMRAKEGF